jgi:tetratricopeptide (TPR) repeat protein
LKLFPEDVRVQTEAAEYYLNQNQMDLAEQYNNGALEIRPKYTPALIVRGQIALAQKQTDDAVRLFEQLVKDEPNNASAHYFKGLAYAQKGQAQIARESLYKASALDPRLIKANLLLGELHLSAGNIEEVQAQCERVFKIHPNYPPALNLSGRAFMLANKYTEAKKVYTQYVAAVPNDPAGYLKLGQIDFADKKFDDALANYNKALAINPNLLDVFANMILVHTARKEFDTALAMCDEKIRQAKDAPELQGLMYHFKGELYQAKKEIAAAEAAYKSAIESNPKMVKSYLALARIQMAQGNEGAAIAQYNSALEANPKQPAVHMALGTIYEIKSDFDQAEGHYRKALEINPEFSPAANNLAYLIVDRPDGDLNEALVLAQKAKEAFPDNPGVMDTLGWVYYKKKLFESARVELLGSIEQLPDNPLVNYHLGMAFFALEQKEMARQYLGRALELDGAFAGADDARSALAEL